MKQSTVKLLDDLLIDAIRLRSSDIHLQFENENLNIRFRIDGVLYDKKKIEKETANQLLSRIKVVSNLDLAEKRLPQDGKFWFKNADLRVSSFPTLYGEKIVIRILDRADKNFSLNILGFNERAKKEFERLISSSTGFIIVTGPTGSGKTTTLYSVLSSLDKNEKNIVTLEDPIEYSIDKITQSQINNEIGFTFASGIRSILRQDPDILMVGEIRDRETADVAIRASLTGHLVFSTMHTNDSVSAITRLIEMQIEPFLISAALSGVLSQRLVRKLCSQCCFETKLTVDENEILRKMNLEITKCYDAKGCASCNYIGYKGRVGIFELLILDSKLKSFISNNYDYNQILQHAIKNGFKLLVDDAIEKVNAGITSIKEILKTLM
ncbi:GspE/PulE family protein [Candidatus Dependentiae bacterium]|nr:GspE/PulE family protein [Candidatus Dependentiae bacterium]